jgi:hypothetical protein
VTVSSDEDRPIIVATNFGAASRAGLDKALAVARVRDRQVVVLHVLRPPARTSPLRFFERAYAERRLRSHEKMKEWLGTTVSLPQVFAWIEPGDPERLLVETTVGASCLVLGSCSRLGIGARVAERARCPVHVASRWTIAATV